MRAPEELLNGASARNPLNVNLNENNQIYFDQNCSGVALLNHFCHCKKASGMLKKKHNYQKTAVSWTLQGCKRVNGPLWTFPDWMPHGRVCVCVCVSVELRPQQRPVFNGPVGNIGTVNR